MSDKKTSIRTKYDTKTRLALLENQVMNLEVNISNLSADTKAQLAIISKGVHELHEKMDNHIIKQTEGLAVLQTKQEGNESEFTAINHEIARLDGKIWKATSVVGSLLAAIFTGAFELIKKL